MWSDFTEYIVNNYANSTKIVEVGVGKVLEPSDILRDMLKTTLINTVDIYPANDTVLKDDITHPTDSIYVDADLIYSIRPPEELQKTIFDLGLKYNTDIIIKPLFTEEINYNLQTKLKLVNYKKTAFYIYKNE
ncbi:MAG: hypothetical protein BZ135_08280 [Methanosphaera sp. rholeuAM6]|nr:MAG: hypothetical protein BZ135_08280 [Methanosphaera sp. rholeuAM6]